jgi:hypothetical protein
MPTVLKLSLLPAGPHPIPTATLSGSDTLAPLPPLPRRSPPRSPVSATLLRYLFPTTRHRARIQLHKLRHDYLPRLKHRAQSRIYRFIVQRQVRKQLRNSPSILSLLRQRGRVAFAKRYKTVKDARAVMTQPSAPGGFGRNGSSQEIGVAGDVAAGSKRAKLKGYLKAANELRQSYQQQYSSGWNNRESWVDNPEDGTPGAYPDASVVRSGSEEMILFPSYARKHYKVKVGFMRRCKCDNSDYLTA